MTLGIVFHPKVFSEVDTIMAYCEKVSGSTLAVDFYDEFLQFVGKAAQQPEIYGLQTGELRRVNLHRFPYNFLFRIMDDHIRILVVRHHARKPTYGTGRV